MAQKDGADRSRGRGLKIPRRHLDRRLQILRSRSVPGTKVLISTADFVATTSARPSPRTRSRRARRALPGRGAAGSARLQAPTIRQVGIGVDVDQSTSRSASSRAASSGRQRRLRRAKQSSRPVQGAPTSTSNLKNAAWHRQDQSFRARLVHQADEQLQGEIIPDAEGSGRDPLARDGSE